MLVILKANNCSYLRSVHQDNQPVVDGDDDVPLPDSTLPSWSRLNHVLHDQVETVVFTEITKCLTDYKQLEFKFT